MPTLKVKKNGIWEYVQVASGTESGTGGNITVDSTLSDTSTNPVQNKAVYSAIESLESKIGESSVYDQASDIVNTALLTSFQYGDVLPNPGTPGRIFFLRTTEEVTV